MADDMREVAQRLYNRVRRLNDGKVATVGFSKSVQGNPVFVVYLLEDAPMVCPAKFEGYGVLYSVSKGKATEAAAR